MQNKNMSKQKRAEEKKFLSDIVGGKITVIFFALFAAVLLFVRLNGGMTEAWLATKARLWICLALGICTAAALVWCFLDGKRGVDHRRKVFTAPLLLGMSAALFTVVLLYPLLGAVLSIVLLFAAALLFFVFEVYPIDFFLFSIVTELSAAALLIANRLVRIGKPALGWLLWALVLLCGAAVTFAAYKLARDGKWQIGRWRVKKPQGMMPAAVALGAVVSVLCILGTILFGYPLYFTFAVCGVYLVAAIIYTVKLM